MAGNQGAGLDPRFTLFGMPIIVDANMAELITREPARQIRFPRSKKRRIREKWTRNRRNWRAAVVVAEPRAYRAGGAIYCHPAIYDQLMREFSAKPRTSANGEAPAGE